MTRVTVPWVCLHTEDAGSSTWPPVWRPPSLHAFRIRVKKTHGCPGVPPPWCMARRQARRHLALPSPMTLDHFLPAAPVRTNPTSRSLPQFFFFKHLYRVRSLSFLRATLHCSPFPPSSFIFSSMIVLLQTQHPAIVTPAGAAHPPVATASQRHESAFQ